MVEVYLVLAAADGIRDTKIAGLGQWHWVGCFPTTPENRLIPLSTLPM